MFVICCVLCGPFILPVWYRCVGHKHFDNVDFIDKNYYVEHENKIL